MKERKRPVNLNLATIHFPSPAIASILHRISGVILFLTLPLLLWLLQTSLNSSGYTTIQDILHSFWLRFVVWGVLSALIYHLLAGIRHFLMDLHIGEEKYSGRISAWIVFLVSIVLIIFIGIWLWLPV